MGFRSGAMLIVTVDFVFAFEEVGDANAESKGSSYRSPTGRCRDVKWQTCGQRVLIS